MNGGLGCIRGKLREKPPQILFRWQGMGPTPPAELVAGCARVRTKTPVLPVLTACPVTQPSLHISEEKTGKLR